MVVRCKLRCMSILKEMNGYVIRFLPVVAKSDQYPGGAEENRQFFRWTPSGELILRYPRIAIPPFNVSDYFYVDLHEAEDGEWLLSSVYDSGDSVTPNFELSWKDRPGLAPAYGHVTDKQPGGLSSGSLSLQINNDATYACFRGKARTTWSLSISPAEACPGASFP